MKSEYDGTSHLNIINSTIRDNPNFGIHWDRVDPNYEEVTPLVLNSVLWNPSSDDLYSTGVAWTTNEVSYTDNEDGDWNSIAGNFSAEPLWFDDIHQTACSPTINAGTITPDVPLYDIDGDSRVAGNAPDVGADEFPGYFCLLTTDLESSDDSVHIGDTIFYTITLTNTTTVTPAIVTLIDVLPASLSLVSISNEQTNLDGTGSNVFQWSGTILPSTTQTLHFQAQAVSADPSAEHYAAITTTDGGLYRSPSVFVVIETYKTLLAAIFNPEPPPPPPTGIFGTVTFTGNPIAGVPLSLRFYNGSTWSTMANTITADNGSFSFTNVPTLGANQVYYVRYLNSSAIPGYLYTWNTKLLENYTIGTNVEIGNFDIADVVLLTPAAGANVTLPRTFSWIPRLTTLTDSYEYNLYDPIDFDPYAYTDPPLGYVGSFTITGLPPGFVNGITYVWEIWVYAPDGGVGISLEARPVKFSNLNTAEGFLDIQSLLNDQKKWILQDWPKK